MKKIFTLLTFITIVLCAAAQKQTVDVVMTNLNIENYWFMFTASGSNSEYSLSLTVNSYSITGEFSDSDISSYTVFTDKSGKNIQLASRHAVVTGTEGSYVVKADLLSTDDILYKVTMTYNAATIGEQTIDFSDMAKVRHSDVLNETYVTTKTSDYQITLCFKGNMIDGNCGNELMNTEKCMLTNRKTSEIIAFRTITAQVSSTASVANITAKAVGKNDIEYTLTLAADMSEQSFSESDITLSSALMAESFSGTHCMGMEGKSDDGNNYVRLMLKTDRLEGTYTAADISPLSYVAVIGSSDMNYYDILQGTVTASREGDDVTLTARVLCANDIIYNIVMRHAEGRLTDDAVSGDVNVSYTDNVTIIDNTTTDGTMTLEAKAADGSDVMLLRFFVQASDSGNIPTGEYTIDGSGAPGTVAASSGIDGIIPTLSYYTTLDTDDGMVKAFYFLVAGTVNVEVSGNTQTITVDARNSCDVPVKATISLKLNDSGITTPHLKQQHRKYINGNQILINSNGRTYNDVGIRQRQK